MTSHPYQFLSNQGETAVMKPISSLVPYLLSLIHCLSCLSINQKVCFLTVGSLCLVVYLPSKDNPSPNRKVAFNSRPYTCTKKYVYTFKKYYH